jgi:hypothetical protein
MLSRPRNRGFVRSYPCQYGFLGRSNRLAQAFQPKRNVQLKAYMPLQHPACADNIRVCRGSGVKPALQHAESLSGTLQFSRSNFLDDPLGKQLKLGLVAPREGAGFRFEKAQRPEPGVLLRRTMISCPGCGCATSPSADRRAGSTSGSVLPAAASVRSMPSH